MENGIILGDTLSVLRGLPADVFDVGVTSPPYNKGERHQGWLVPKVTYHANSDRHDEADYQAEQIAVLNELYRVTKPGGSFFYNHKLRWDRGWLQHPFSWVSKTDWVVRQEIIWQRKIAGNIRGWRFWQVEERIYWLHKPRPEEADAPIGTELESRHAKMTSIWDIRPERKLDWAPDPFPLELAARCIYSILGDGKGSVIEPYSGSGTTLVAAKLLGYDYVGIDISEEYTARARERLANAFMEKDRLAKEVALHKVGMTFKQRKARGISKPRQRRERLL
jgi:site-specific DNA-methyltransferase (adenine-specific)